MGLRTYLGLKKRPPPRVSPPSHALEWWVGKEFSHDMAGTRLGHWVRVLAPYRNQVTHICEIGSWEGQSAIFWLEFFPSAHLTCIDTFKGSSHHQGPDFAHKTAGIEERFDRNLVPYGSRVEKLKARSIEALDRLRLCKREFDLVYIDGSHERDEVMIDCVLAWQVTRPGGIVIWDDYRFGADNPENNPGPAINAFLAMHATDASVLFDSGDQLFAVKSPTATLG